MPRHVPIRPRSGPAWPQQRVQDDAEGKDRDTRVVPHQVHGPQHPARNHQAASCREAANQVSGRERKSPLGSKNGLLRQRFGPVSGGDRPDFVAQQRS